MGFYSRHSGLGFLPGTTAGRPGIVADETHSGTSVDSGPAKVAPAVPARERMLPAIQPPAATYQKNVPTFPIGPLAPPMKFILPPIIQQMVKADPGPAKVTGATPAPARAEEAVRSAINSDARSVKAASIAAAAVARATVATAENDAAAERARQEADRAVQAAAAAAAETASKIAKADEERIKKAAEDALAESNRARIYNESHPSGGGGGGGGGSSYSPPEETIVEVPLNDGSTAGVIVKPHSPLMAAAIAGAGGFLVLGPLGAVLGAAASYFLTKPKLASQISYYRR